MTTRTLHLARSAALLTERSDGELLDLFVRQRDEGAFADVVRRHGPMVLGVCRRVLRDGPDADDAFQAAFLVLARRAASIAAVDRLANWLHGVAFNTARKLRRANARRQRRETLLSSVPEPSARPVPDADWLAVLDAELTRLPQKYRTPIVLCDLEGRTRGEVARSLGWPEGTVAGRLARARALLGRRLAARGVVPGVVAAVVVPASLITASARAAARGVAPPGVAALTDGVIQTMIRAKLRTAAALLVAGVAAVAGLSTLPSVALTQPPAKKDAPDPRAGSGDPPTPAAAKTLTAFPLRDLTPEQAVKELEKHAKAAILTPVPDQRTLLIYADEKTRAEIELDLRKLGEVLAVPTVVRLHKLDAVKTAATLQTLLKDRLGTSGVPPSHRQVTIVPVPAENTLLVFASAEKIQLMFAVLKDLGEAVDPTVTTIRLRNGNAEAVARQLTEVFNGPGRTGWFLIPMNGPPRGRVIVTAVPGTDQIVVYATPNDLEVIRKLVELIDADPAPVRDRVVPLAPPAAVYTMEFRDVAWADVLDWYAKTSGLTFVAATRPTGKITLTPGKDKKFTLAEVTDLMNELLMQQKLLLVRREKTFTVIPLDEKPDPSLFLRVVLDGFPNRGQTELVEVLIPLPKETPVKDHIDEIKKLLGPYADVQAVTARNAVLVRDAAGNVRRIQEILKPFGAPPVRR